MVRATQVHKSFGRLDVLRGIDLVVNPGEVLCLIGPSGSGKSTFLRCINHLEKIDGGELAVDGELVGYRRSGDRLYELKDREVCGKRAEIGMVFQRFNLFPHMSVLDNVMAGPVRVKRESSSTARDRAVRLLERVGLADKVKSYPNQLSGGQQQRVALARALAIRPSVLLLDEPLSALDARVRSQLRDEIRRVQREVGITTLFVTHDQEEALAIADRVGVMRAGRLEQLGPPTSIYSQPATPFVAEFVGLTNRLAGVVTGGAVDVRGIRLPLIATDTPDGPAVALVRPEAVSLAPALDGFNGPLSGTVIAVSFLGAVSRLTIDLGDTTVLVQVPTAEAAAHPGGSRVRIALRLDPVLITREGAQGRG